ncbi:cysteine hydrolase family protein [Streptomyces sp. NPDC059786]|uniref:cysteine hydrolase family protein n=1 Tax=Streptomyces sp. NPDC059786 TaxID=3346946 RepID=UPI00365AA346
MPDASNTVNARPDAPRSGTALLVMDLQRGHLTRVGDPGYLPRVASAIGAARSAGIPVIHVKLGFRPGHPEVGAGNRVFSALPPDAYTEDDPDAAIHPDVAPVPGETVVVKNRVSAFAGNDLRQVLAAGSAGHLVLAGIATSGVVLSTACEAFDLDYRLTFLADGCADRDPELHRALMERVFAHRGDVSTVAGWNRSVTGAAA